MFETNDQPVSLYKDIRLSDVAKKLEMPHIYIPSTINDTLSVSNEIQEYQKQIGYLRTKIIRFSQLENDYETLKQEYKVLQNKYESLLSQNIQLHSGNKRSSPGLQNQLSQANDKVSSLLKINQFLQKQKICLQRQLISIKNIYQNSQKKEFKLQGDIQIILSQKLQLEQMVQEQRRQKHLLLSKYDKQLKQLSLKMQEDERKFKQQRHTVDSLLSLKHTLESDMKQLRVNNRSLQQSLRNKNQQIVNLQIKIKCNSNDFKKIENLQKQIQIKDKLFQQTKARYEGQNKEVIKNYETKINNLFKQNLILKQSQNDYESNINNLTNVISQSQTLKISLKNSQTQIHDLKTHNATLKSLLGECQVKMLALINKNQSLTQTINNNARSYQHLKTNHNDSLSTIQSLQSHLISLKDSSAKLQFENTKLESALYTSQIQSEQTRLKTTQLSRVCEQADYYKQQSSRLKQQVDIIKKRSKQMEHNYRSLLDHVKQNQELKPRQSNESRKSCRSHRSKQTHHAQITLSSTARTKSSNKSRTELSQLTHLDQYKSVIESKLLKPSISRNESMNEKIMKRCKLFLNR